MVNPFVRKLRHGAPLSDDDEDVLLRISQPVRHVDARGDIALEGESPRLLAVVMDGWACRYKQLENGKRQIISVFLPGDLCEPFGVLPAFMDNSLGALSAAVIGGVTPDGLRNAAQASPHIEEALWWDLLVSNNIEREHLVSLGRRSASERLGHLFCELHDRLTWVDLVDRQGFDMPMTQSDLADMLGLSVVHVNRSLQELRAAGFLSLRERRLTILDLEGLQAASLFEPAYLHSAGRTRNEPVRVSRIDRGDR